MHARMQPSLLNLRLISWSFAKPRGNDQNLNDDEPWRIKLVIYDTYAYKCYDMLALSSLSSRSTPASRVHYPLYISTHQRPRMSIVILTAVPPPT